MSLIPIHPSRLAKSACFSHGIMQRSAMVVFVESQARQAAIKAAAQGVIVEFEGGIEQYSSSTVEDEEEEAAGLGPSSARGLRGEEPCCVAVAHGVLHFRLCHQTCESLTALQATPLVATSSYCCSLGAAAQGAAARQPGASEAGRVVMGRESLGSCCSWIRKPMCSTHGGDPSFQCVLHWHALALEPAPPPRPPRSCAHLRARSLTNGRRGMRRRKHERSARGRQPWLAMAGPWLSAARWAVLWGGQQEGVVSSTGLWVAAVGGARWPWWQ